jgi:hypothetical protein
MRVKCGGHAPAVAVGAAVPGVEDMYYYII